MPQHNRGTHKTLDRIVIQVVGIKYVRSPKSFTLLYSSTEKEWDRIERPIVVASKNRMLGRWYYYHLLHYYMHPWTSYIQLDSKVKKWQGCKIWGRGTRFSCTTWGPICVVYILFLFFFHSQGDIITIIICIVSCILMI